MTCALFATGFATSGAQDAIAPAPQPSPGLCSSPDQPAKTLRNVRAVSPPGAQNLAGTVVVIITLDEKSHVVGTAIASSTSFLLNAAALQAARDSTFQTAVRNCKPVAMSYRYLVTFNGGGAAAVAPSISDYFSGTWSCVSALDAQVVKAYGVNGASLMLLNASISTNRTVNSTIQTYTEPGAVITVSEKRGLATTFTGTSNGWNGDRMEFNGFTTTAPVAGIPSTAFAGTSTVSERMTYVRTDRDHFSRTFESAPVETGPWTQVSSERCTRIAAPGAPAAAPAAANDPGKPA